MMDKAKSSSVLGSIMALIRDILARMGEWRTPPLKCNPSTRWQRVVAQTVESLHHQVTIEYESRWVTEPSWVR